jgi:hypothetical protein
MPPTGRCLLTSSMLSTMVGALACGQVGAGTPDTSLDAGKDRNARVVNAEGDSNVQVGDAGVARR